jgi:(S)-mandelate dehydrogenase
MGGPSIVWPGADQYLAAAAQRARVPYTLGLVGGMTVERAAEIAPDGQPLAFRQASFSHF